VVLAVFALWSRFRHRSLFVLDAGIAFAFSLTVAALGMMSPDFGGLDGVYPHGLAFYYVGCSALIPAPWPRMLGILLPIHVSYFATAAVAVLLDPVVTGQWHTPGGVAFFNVHIIMETALLLFATVSGHLLWTSRRQLKEARQLGRYRLTAPLGEGAMNEVWLARDATLGREVALKMLRTDPGVYDDRWIRFEREAHATSTLTSPHTIKIFDYGASDDGIAYIAMEYLRGMDLFAMVRRYGPIDVSRAVHFARQACLSLAEAHERGLVHRDVKPANLFALSSAGQEDFLKVLDFGVVREQAAGAGDPSQDRAMIGTPAFMAPEQFVAGDAVPAADIYAMGATLYFLLTGAPPFEVSTDLRLRRAHTSAPVIPPSLRRGQAVPAALEAIIARCMAKHPVDRYRDGAALICALDDLPEIAPWTPADARAWWAQIRMDGTARRAADSSRVSAG